VPRLRLRAPHPDDFEALFEGVWSSPEVMRFVGPPRSRALAAERFAWSRALFERTGMALWTVEDRESGQVRCTRPRVMAPRAPRDRKELEVRRARSIDLAGSPASGRASKQASAGGCILLRPTMSPRRAGRRSGPTAPHGHVTPAIVRSSTFQPEQVHTPSLSMLKPMRTWRAALA